MFDFYVYYFWLELVGLVDLNILIAAHPLTHTHPIYIYIYIYIYIHIIYIYIHKYILSMHILDIYTLYIYVISITYSIYRTVSEN